MSKDERTARRRWVVVLCTLVLPVSVASAEAPPLGAANAPEKDASRPRTGDATPATVVAPTLDWTPPTRPWRANRPLVIVGTSLFAAGYLPSLAVGLPSTGSLVLRVFLWVLGSAGACAAGSKGYPCSGHHGAMQLLIPVAGPILFANSHPRDSLLETDGSPLSPGTKGLLYTGAALQIAGLAAFIGAAAFGSRDPEPERDLELPSLLVSPLGVPGSVGLAVGVRRW